ncbi:MAG: TSUP family transporter [Eggerthellaceae bacterium]|nr:TSUP family transporter [Eggerthellaceae bacterium]
MELSLTSFLIVCPVCFFVGVMNASVGGGGLISLPAMLLVGLPPHMAIGTNKLQAICGLSIALFRYAKSGLIELKLAIPTVACALVGSLIGSNLSLLVPAHILSYIVVGVLPIVAIFVFKRDSFIDDSDRELVLDRRTYLTACACSAVIGAYDGFYGPGAGTFYVIAFCMIVQMGARQASAQAKVVNLSTNVAATIVFLVNGYVCLPLGLAGGVCGMLGAWLGAGLVIRDGARIMKPLIALAFILVVVKLVGGF